MKLVFRVLLVTVAAALMALNINTFVLAGGLLPGGFSGISLLIQEVFKTYLHINVPYSPIYLVINIIPAIICFRYVGKKFTLLSIWMLVLSGLLTDFIPGLHITDDVLLSSVFGGIINGIAICLCLLAGATSGGTDFISIYVAQKTGKCIWNKIFIGNCCVLIIFGILFGWTRALYSIIFQYAATQIINTVYKRYQKDTLFIVTEKSKEVIDFIKNSLNHSATIFTGSGGYSGTDRKMIYTVISSDEEYKLVQEIKKIDKEAFINTIKTKSLTGNFFMKKND